MSSIKNIRNIQTNSRLVKIKTILYTVISLACNTHESIIEYLLIICYNETHIFNVMGCYENKNKI